MKKIIDEIKARIDKEFGTNKFVWQYEDIIMILEQIRPYVERLNKPTPYIELAEETIRCYYEDIEYGADPEGSYSNREIELIKQINKQEEAEVKDE